MQSLHTSQIGVKGIVERRLLNRERFFQSLENLGVEFDLSWHRRSELFQEFVVVRMRADPIPDD